ncbi:MAG: DUF7144 family membrane protein [Acidimicrobiia bacterium]
MRSRRTKALGPQRFGTTSPVMAVCTGSSSCVGVIAAGVSILVNFSWLPWYPLWSMLMIAAGGFVIWALTAHGRDIVAARDM